MGKKIHQIDRSLYETLHALKSYGISNCIHAKYEWYKKKALLGFNGKASDDADSHSAFHKARRDLYLIPELIFCCLPSTSTQLF